MESDIQALREDMLKLRRDIDLLKQIVIEKDLSAWEEEDVLADESLLAEGWLSKEDEEAFAYLQ